MSDVQRPPTSAWTGHQARQVRSDEVARRALPLSKLWLVGELATGPRRVGVVGARDCTGAQREAAWTLCHGLVQAGVTVVSGGALGIDTAAHEATMHHGGTTVVCLPAGVATGGNHAQRRLCGEVLRSGGAVVSCERPEAGHLRGGYRRRNEVIVGLVDALVVICGGDPSGTLITARLAEKADIPRCAVPWAPGTPTSDGSNDLLAAGWRALHRLTDPAAVLRALELEDAGSGSIDVAGRRWQRYAPPTPQQPQSLRAPGGTDPQLVAAIDRALAEQPDEGLSLEELVDALRIDRGVLAPLVLQLRLTGQLRQVPFGRYLRCG